MLQEILASSLPILITAKAGSKKWILMMIPQRMSVAKTCRKLLLPTTPRKLKLLDLRQMPLTLFPQKKKAYTNLQQKTFRRDTKDCWANFLHILKLSIPGTQLEICSPAMH